MRTFCWLVAAMALAGCATHSPTPMELSVRAFQHGYAALQAGDWDAAERSFQEAARLNPDDAYTLLDLGVVEQHLGKRDEARAAYNRAIDLGKTVHPRDVTDPVYAARTVAQLAQDDLTGMDAPPPSPPQPPAKKQSSGGPPQ